MMGSRPVRLGHPRRAVGLVSALALVAALSGPTAHGTPAPGTIDRVSVPDGGGERNVLPTGSSLQCNAQNAGRCTKRTVAVDSANNKIRVVFAAAANNLVPNDANGRSDIFLTTLSPSATAGAPPTIDSIERINIGLGGVEASGESQGPSISPNGQWVFAYGDAKFFGSTGAIRLSSPIVGMTSTPSGQGYWFVAADSGIFSFGDARFYGSMGGQPLSRPIVSMASTPTGKGYRLVASDGGIFANGDAKFYGSTGNIKLSKPIVGMDRTASGNGYRFVASDGGIFSFGDAKFLGSAGGQSLSKPIVGMARTRSGDGYWLVGQDGAIFSFGAAGFQGSTADQKLSSPIVGMAN
jgi:hypothetical protein